MYTNQNLQPYAGIRIGSMIKTLKLSCCCAAIALLATGCGKTLKKEVNEPTKLVKIEQSINVVNPVVSKSLSGSSKQNIAGRLEVGFDGQQIIAASPTGDIDSFNLSGNKLWSIDIDSDIVGGVSFDAASKTAIVTTKSAEVIAINSNNGSIKWRHKLEATVLSPALIDNNRAVLLANDGTIHGLAISTGQPIWQLPTQAPSISLRGSAKPVLLDYDTAVVANAEGRLHAVKINTGLPQWSRRVGIPIGASEIDRMTDIDGTPIVDRGQLFAVSYSGQLIGFDLNTGQGLFLQDIASKNSLALTNNAVIATSLDGMVKAFNRNTGELLWESDALAYRQLSNPVMVGNYIAIGDMDGVVHFLSPEDGKIMSRTQTKGAVVQLQAQSGYLMTQTKGGQVAVWQVAQ